MNSLKVSTVEFVSGSPGDAAHGLLGFARFLLNGSMRVDGVAVRRGVDGCLFLSWPARTDRSGRRHPVLHPISDAARRDLEAQVLAALAHQLESEP